MAVTNLPFIRQEMIRYGMTMYLALGLIGNICNCIVFMQRSYRRMPSSIYFLFLSIFANIYLIWSLFPLLYSLDHTFTLEQSLFYCKVRTYGTHTLGQWLRYIVVFACIDRFMVTRTSIRIRSLSSTRLAMKLIFIICVVWLIVAMHLPILMDIRNGVCDMFDLYKSIYPIYQITLVGILPPVLMTIFSTLTIRSLQQRHNIQVRFRQRDRYLTRMVIAEVIVNIFTSIPYSAYLVYDAVTYRTIGKSPQRVEIESFIYFITLFLIYLISVAPFYLFILTSKPFRNEFIHLLIKYWNKYILRRVRIAPLNEQNIAL